MKGLCALAAASLAVGCSTPPPTTASPRPVERPAYGEDPTALVLTSLADDRPVVVSLAGVSCWIGRDGSGLGQKAYAQSSDGSPLQEIRNPLAVRVLFDGQLQTPSDTGYRQVLDLRTGSVRTDWQSTDVTVTVTCEVMRSSGRFECLAAATAKRPGKLEVSWGRVSPPLEHLGSSWPQQDDHARAGTVVKVKHAVKERRKALAGPHATIEIDGPVEDGQFVNAMVHYVCGGAGDGLGPFGTTHPRYDGRVFWDQDAWVFPVVALLDPPRARAIVAFRSGARMAAARAAAQGPSSVKGALRFPWESGPDGQEVARKDNRDEIHVSGAVARMFALAADLGLADDRTAREAVEGVAAFYRSRLQKTSDGKLGLFGVRSPDEYQLADNDLYTNALAEWCLQRSDPNGGWRGKLRRPHDGTTFLTYDGDPLMGYQQAAALLALWPLQDPDCEQEADAMLKRFVGKATPNGPSMTASVESLLLARFGSPDQAYREWKAGVARATERPMMMLSESPRKAEAYFVTGAAGFLDSVLYGFLGLRFDDDEPQGVPWKRRLRTCWLSCAPHLPKAWSKIAVKGLYLSGKRYDLVATRSGVSLSPTPAAPTK